MSLFSAPILAYPISGRFSAALIPCVTAPAKPDGLGSLLKDSSLWRCILGGLLGFCLWIALMGAGSGLSADMFKAYLRFLPLPLFSVLGSLGIARLYRKHLGGYTGDALGAAVELGELLHLGGAFFILRFYARLEG
jgi:adenosylcobinamide-GDP ribazoletransferase